MNSTTKVLLVVGVVAAVGGAAFWAYKKHPEWFKPGTQNPNQVNPASQSSAKDKTSQQITAGMGALESLSNVAHDWLG